MNALLKEVELGKIYTIGVKGINEVAQQQIMDIIRTDIQGRYYVDIDWDEIESGDTKRGKAIANQLYKHWSYKMPENIKSRIGTVASQGEDDYTYHFEIIKLTGDNWWNDGDFGDRGSCYWGSNSGARDMLVENDAYAVRVFNDADPIRRHRGIGRAWLYPIDNQNLIIWNGYLANEHYNRETRHFAGMLAKFMGVPYKRIYLSNNREYDGVLYINSGHGFVIGPNADEYKEYDLGWNDIHSLNCYNCGDRVGEEYWHEGSAYCEYCFHEIFSRCSRCDEVEYADNLNYIETTNEEVCYHCYRTYYSECGECGEVYPDSELQRSPIDSFSYLCEDCYDRLKEKLEEEEEAIRLEEEEASAEMYA